MSTEIIQAPIVDIESYLDELDSRFYHNRAHTEEVVISALRLAEECGVSDEEKILLEWAAWGHDLGYIEGEENHEKEGAEITGHLMKQSGFTNDEIDIVKRIICSTKVLPHENGSVRSRPETLLQKILCDADLSTVGLETFEKSSYLLKKEWEEQENKGPWTEKAWVESQIFFLEKHSFHCDEAKVMWEDGKKENLQIFREKLKQL